jgi:hypothetical protein
MDRTMTNELKKILQPDDLEYLTFDQAAAICSISLERLIRWIDKGMLPVITLQEQRLIRAQDLIQHLIRHNIRIPERLLQGSIKKILCILMQTEIPVAMTRDILWALYRQKDNSSYVFDFIELNSDTELKIITFDPDVIFLLQTDGSKDSNTTGGISKMLTKEVPIHLFPVNREIDIDLLFND